MGWLSDGLLARQMRMGRFPERKKPQTHHVAKIPLCTGIRRWKLQKITLDFCLLGGDVGG